jgi:hypothetical protein
LSFGIAQDGEPAEPFRISNFDIRILVVSEIKIGIQSGYVSFSTIDVD